MLLCSFFLCPPALPCLLIPVRKPIYSRLLLTRSPSKRERENGHIRAPAQSRTQAWKGKHFVALMLISAICKCWSENLIRIKAGLGFLRQWKALNGCAATTLIMALTKCELTQMPRHRSQSDYSAKMHQFRPSHRPLASPYSRAWRTRPTPPRQKNGSGPGPGLEPTLSLSHVNGSLSTKCSGLKQSLRLCWWTQTGLGKLFLSRLDTHFVVYGGWSPERFGLHTIKYVLKKKRLS